MITLINHDNPIGFTKNSGCESVPVSAGTQESVEDDQRMSFAV